MLGKFEFYWFFHGLRISETNNFRNDINKNNIKWFTTSSYVLVQFLQKTLCFDRNLLCFVSLYLPRSCLLLVAYNKTNILCLFCLISKLFTLSNIIFNSASLNYLGWIISDSKQKGMEYLLININIVLALTNDKCSWKVGGK